MDTTTYLVIWENQGQQGTVGLRNGDVALFDASGHVVTEQRGKKPKQCADEVQLNCNNFESYMDAAWVLNVARLRFNMLGLKISERK